VLFADVSNFTGFSENRDVEEVVTFLNELFSLLSEVVFRHGGIVDKFVGDCVMALFGAHEDGPSARAAVAAAEDMIRFVESSSESWKKRWGFDVSLGIGIATGTALVGNLGSESRMEFTAIGDVVNIAARLETMARPGQVLVTSAVVGEATQGFEYEALGKVALRGKRDEVELYALVTE
ncbi:MAG: adenylate/guanylate cyclase domain-containing protein, partial [Proteobacteria bacterium]